MKSLLVRLLKKEKSTRFPEEENKNTDSLQKGERGFRFSAKAKGLWRGERKEKKGGDFLSKRTQALQGEFLGRGEGEGAIIFHRGKRKEEAPSQRAEKRKRRSQKRKKRGATFLPMREKKRRGLSLGGRRKGKRKSLTRSLLSQAGPEKPPSQRKGGGNKSAL